MRGKAFHTKNSLLLIRITPAYAGKRENGSSGEPRKQDHPRLCGEKHTNFQELLFRSGSPPPMRGKATCTLANNDIIGITPAYAGKSFRNFIAVVRIKDHPRLCGEKLWTHLTWY